MDIGKDYLIETFSEKYGKNIYFYKEGKIQNFYKNFGLMTNDYFEPKLYNLKGHGSVFFLLPLFQKEKKKFNDKSLYYSGTISVGFEIKNNNKHLKIEIVSYTNIKKSAFYLRNEKNFYFLTNQDMFISELPKDEIKIKNLTINLKKIEDGIFFSEIKIDHRKNIPTENDLYILNLPFIKNFFEKIDKYKNISISIIPNDGINILKFYKNEFFKSGNEELFRSLSENFKSFSNISQEYSKLFRYISNRFKIIILTKEFEKILQIYKEKMVETIENFNIGNTILTIGIYPQEEGKKKFEEFRSFELDWITQSLSNNLYYIPKLYYHTEKRLKNWYGHYKEKLLSKIKNYDLRSELFDNHFLYKILREINGVSIEGEVEEFKEDEYEEFLKDKKYKVNCVVNWLEHKFYIKVDEEFHVFRLFFGNKEVFKKKYKESTPSEKFLLYYQLFLTDYKIKLVGLEKLFIFLDDDTIYNKSLEEKMLNEKFFFKTYRNFKITINNSLLQINESLKLKDKSVYYEIVNNIFSVDNLYNILKELYRVIGFLYFNKKSLNNLIFKLIDSFLILYKDSHHETIEKFLLELDLRRQYGILEEININTKIELDTDGIFKRVTNPPPNEIISNTKAGDLMMDYFVDYFTKEDTFKKDKLYEDFKLQKLFKQNMFNLFISINEIVVMNENLSEGTKNEFFKSGVGNNLLSAMNFFIRFISRKEIREIFTNLNILYNTLFHGQGKIYQQDKHIVNSQLIIITSSLNILSNILNDQFSFVAAGKKSIKDLISFYNLLSLKIEKEKMHKFNYMKRERVKIERFKKKLRDFLPNKNNMIKKKLVEFDRVDKIKYEYLVTILYHLYKLVKGYGIKELKEYEKRLGGKNLTEIVYLTYDGFKKMYFPEDLKNELLNLYFKKIKGFKVYYDPFLRIKSKIEESFLNLFYNTITKLIKK